MVWFVIIILVVVVIFLFRRYSEAQEANQSFDRVSEFIKDPRKMSFLREKSTHENQKLENISSLLNLLEQKLITKDQFLQKLEIVKQKDLEFALKYRDIMTKEEYNQMLDDGDILSKAFEK
jgi:hypothetical protein